MHGVYNFLDYCLERSPTSKADGIPSTKNRLLTAVYIQGACASSSLPFWQTFSHIRCSRVVLYGSSHDAWERQAFKVKERRRLVDLMRGKQASGIMAPLLTASLLSIQLPKKLDIAYLLGLLNKTMMKCYDCCATSGILAQI